MTNSQWQSRFPKQYAPAYEELLAFLPAKVRSYFISFNDEMNCTYRVYNKWQRYENDFGWVYGYCRNYRCELLSVSIGDDCFCVLGIEVRDEESLGLALQKAKEVYESGYEDRYARLVAAKKADQIQRTRVRLAREKEHMDRLKETLDPERFNRFKWASKVSRSKLIRLYQSEAQGLLDENLLDDVGYSFYTRCKQAKEARKAMEKGQIVCHTCDKALMPADDTAVAFCPCGYSYTYREYRRSCNAANMPGGRADPVFRSFAEKWPGCKSSTEKMLLIDWLVHECHVTIMSGEKGRSVCVNLIEGTHAQLRDMLEMLAGHQL
ncbi:MAG: hypothetical protein LBI19_02210 [Oscillospiraceae bacterium]|nr:hypothetical protein [Oscillospiraceae bacterium]